MESMEITHLAITKEQLKFMKLQAKFDAYTLQSVGLANTQLKEEIESQQGESCEEEEINFRWVSVYLFGWRVSQSWLQEQAQLLKFQESIHDDLIYMKTQLTKGRVELRQEIDQFGKDIQDLEDHLNKKVEVFDVKSPIVVDDDQLVDQKEKIQPFNYIVFLNVNIEKEYKSENVDVALELGHLGSHSKYFSILCLIDDMKFESSELMVEFLDEEQNLYILKFSSPHRQNDIHHIRTKKCKMQHLVLGSFILYGHPLSETEKSMQIYGCNSYVQSRKKSGELTCVVPRR
uniref:Uncharacterized protein n=1 Tax=Solanum tuberosum TaxID=4113 RepID=M1DTZ9_SOLTU